MTTERDRPSFESIYLDLARVLARRDFERGVLAELKSVREYVTFLEEQGYDADDIDLLVELLTLEIEKDAEGVT